MKTSHRKGFTLIELLVVIAIIAILTAIVTASFAKSKASSRDAKRVSDLAQIQLALELFYDRCGAYPQPNSSSPTAIPLTTSTVTGCPSTVTLGSFISPIPLPPNYASTPPETYDYAVNTNPATDYILRTQLESNNQSILSGGANTATNSTYGNLDCLSTDLYYCVQPKL